MDEVVIRCDRCGKEVKGLHEPGVGTAGYYIVENGLWQKYANPGEKHICDACMWSDTRYLADCPPPGETPDSEGSHAQPKPRNT